MLQYGQVYKKYVTISYNKLDIEQVSWKDLLYLQHPCFHCRVPARYYHQSDCHLHNTMAWYIKNNTHGLNGPGAINSWSNQVNFSETHSRWLSFEQPVNQEKVTWKMKWQSCRPQLQLMVLGEVVALVARQHHCCQLYLHHSAHHFHPLVVHCQPVYHTPENKVSVK